MSKIEKSIAGLRTLQESYDALATRNIEQEEGRKAIANAITSKGVPTAEDASMQQMAENVRNIAQESYELQGDKIYEQQMFGAETISTEPYKQNGPLWNLYKVMTDLLSDSRFSNYGGILLAEYYKGYNTIELMNAGAGGAYFTCDGDFYTTDKAGENAHVWHDGDNGMANRWVAYLFAAPESNYTIPSTNLCPRSIHIGRKVGTIYCSVAGRIVELVTSFGTVNSLNFTSTNPWGAKTVINNIEKHNEGSIVNTNSVVSSFISGVKSLNGAKLITGACANLSMIVLDELESITIRDGIKPLINSDKNNSLTHIELPNLVKLGDSSDGDNTLALFPFRGNNIKVIKYPKLKVAYGGADGGSALENLPNVEEIYMDSLESIVSNFSYGLFSSASLKILRMPKLSSYTATNHYPLFGYTNKLIDLEIGEFNINANFKQWNPTDVLSSPEGITTINANIRDHIAAKVSDRTGQTALTFTVSTNLYNNLEQATKDAFTAKNWRVAGA